MSDMYQTEYEDALLEVMHNLHHRLADNHHDDIVGAGTQFVIVARREAEDGAEYIDVVANGPHQVTTLLGMMTIAKDQIIIGNYNKFDSFEPEDYDDVDLEEDDEA